MMQVDLLLLFIIFTYFISSAYFMGKAVQDYLSLILLDWHEVLIKEFGNFFSTSNFLKLNNISQWAVSKTPFPAWEPGKVG